MPWGWDVRMRRYRDLETGRFMSRQQAFSLADASRLASSSATAQLAQFMTDAVLPATAWGEQLASEVKAEYIRQYMLGRGGRKQMTSDDWAKVGDMISEQMSYLRGFEEEVAAGNLSEAQIASRAKMYVNSAREAFETAQAENAGAVGATEELWVLDGGEHCEDCLTYSAQGWQPIGTFPMPGDGSTACLTNCLCHKVYRGGSEGYGVAHA